MGVVVGDLHGGGADERARRVAESVKLQQRSRSFALSITRTPFCAPQLRSLVPVLLFASCHQEPKAIMDRAPRFGRQPLKAIYLAYELFAIVFIRLPFWTLKSLPRYIRISSDTPTCSSCCYQDLLAQGAIGQFTALFDSMARYICSGSLESTAIMTPSNN